MKILKTPDLSRRTRFFVAVCLLVFAGVTLSVEAKIVFCVDYDIFVMNDDGSDRRRLTHSTQVLDTNPRWSPDGTQIAFTRILDKTKDQTSSEIFVMNADGTDPQRLTDNNFADGYPSWSPDGTRIAWTSPRINGRWEVYIIDLTTRAVKQITGHEGEGPSASPDWAPDGTQIAFERFIVRPGIAEKTIYVMSVDGQHPRPLLPDPPRKGPLTMRYFPRWSADGQQVLFYEAKWFREGDAKRFSVQRIGGRRRDIRAINDRLGNNFIISGACWMADDRAILTSLMLKDKPAPNYDLYLYTFETRGLRRLTRESSDERWPDWTAGALSVSPHGKVPSQWSEIKQAGEETR